MDWFDRPGLVRSFGGCDMHLMGGVGLYPASKERNDSKKSTLTDCYISH